MQVRYVNIKDIESISRLYKIAFDRSYLSVHYSIELLNKYFELLIHQNKYCYVAEFEGRTTGFLIGGFKTHEAVNEFLDKHRKKVFFYALLSPRILLTRLSKLLCSLLKKSPVSKESLRLFIIAVHPDFMNKGLGKQLVLRFEDDIKNDGFNSYGLFVRADNLNALEFYNKRGFICEFKSYNQYSYIKYIQN